MSEIPFDPNHDPESQAEIDLYITWCETQFARLSQGTVRTYRTGLRCAHWLLVIALAQLHLDDGIEANRSELVDQLARYSLLARALERQRERLPIEQLIICRSSLECWEPVGDWSENLLIAAKCAVAALLLAEAHPLIELWELECPDVWALLDCGAQNLADIHEALTLDPEDFSVAPAEMVIAKWTWQKANNLVRHLGVYRLSEN